MPELAVHAYVDKLLFGRSYWRIHRQMDRPYKYLGRYHRILFHDPVFAYTIAKKQYPNDPKAIAAAQCHIAIDNMCTRSPEFKRALTSLARLNKKKSTKGTIMNPHTGRTETWFDRLHQLTDLIISPTARSPVNSRGPAYLDALFFGKSLCGIGLETSRNAKKRR